jgi:DNA-binding transcriptional LysR family regulator
VDKIYEGWLVTSPGITSGRCKALFQILKEDHGPAGRYVCLRDDRGGGKPVGAGKRLGLSLPTVSRKISELETHLGTPLLVRSTRKLALTLAGSAYLPAARNILDKVAAAARLAAGEHSAIRGELVVSAPVLLGQMLVLPVVNAYLTARPEVRVRLLLSDRNANLIDDGVHVAVRIGPLADSAFMAIRIGLVGRVVCGSPGYLAQSAIPLVPGDLDRFSCVTFDCLDVPPVWSFAEPGSAVAVDRPMRPRLSVSTAAAALDAPLAGVGVTQLASYQVAPAVKSGSLQTVLREFEAPSLPVSLLYSRHRSTPPKVRAFLDLAVATLRPVLSAQGQRTCWGEP